MNIFYKYYKKYEFMNTKKDNIFNRISWLLKQKDSGSLYFNYVNKLIFSKKNDKEKEVYTLLNKHTENLEILKKNYLMKKK